MRCTPASAMKGNARGRRPHDVPREGSKIRAVYDLLQANKGCPIEVTLCSGGHSVVRDLMDYYGLDIRCIRQGGGAVKPKWVLAGEWFGRVYIDYIAEHIDQPRSAS